MLPFDGTVAGIDRVDGAAVALAVDNGIARGLIDRAVGESRVGNGPVACSGICPTRIELQLPGRTGREIDEARGACRLAEGIENAVLVHGSDKPVARAVGHDGGPGAEVGVAERLILGNLPVALDGEVGRCQRDYRL